MSTEGGDYMFERANSRRTLFQDDGDYAAFTRMEGQVSVVAPPILKVALLYFDKLIILDSEKASNETLGLQDEETQRM